MIEIWAKYFPTVDLLEYLNTLPPDIVKAKAIVTFRSRLDNYWSDIDYTRDRKSLFKNNSVICSYVNFLSVV